MEGDAGTRQLNPTDAQDTPADELTEQSDPVVDIDERRPSRLGRGWLAVICIGLLILTAAAVVGGVFAIRDHDHSDVVARADAAAVRAAKECVAATHAPDIAAMSASQLKIIECSTGDFGAQATLYSGVLVEAYQAAKAQVQVSDMRAAVERHNDDGSVAVLVAVRTKVTNSESADQEQGYRLRVTMARDEGTYKIAKLEQVTS
jgi:Mce-associated membrane protein